MTAMPHEPLSQEELLPEGLLALEPRRHDFAAPVPRNHLVQGAVRCSC